MKQEELRKKKIYNHKEQQEHVSWCFKNDIKIYGVSTGRWNELQIQINFKGEIITNNTVYKQTKLKPKDKKWWLIVQELYSNYYETGTK